MNKIFVEGKVCKEPRNGTTKAGKPYLSFSISDYKGKEEGVQFMDVFVSGKQAEWIKVSHGSLVSVVGTLSIKKDEKYGTQITIYADHVSNWHESVSRVGSTGNDQTRGADSDCPF